jgi:hypothetical protein
MPLTSPLRLDPKIDRPGGKSAIAHIVELTRVRNTNGALVVATSESPEICACLKPIGNNICICFRSSYLTFTPSRFLVAMGSETGHP